jgi:hypothetical protein
MQAPAQNAAVKNSKGRAFVWKCAGNVSNSCGCTSCCMLDWHTRALMLNMLTCTWCVPRRLHAAGHGQRRQEHQDLGPGLWRLPPLALCAQRQRHGGGLCATHTLPVHGGCALSAVAASVQLASMWSQGAPLAAGFPEQRHKGLRVILFCHALRRQGPRGQVLGHRQV